MGFNNNLFTSCPVRGCFYAQRRAAPSVRRQFLSVSRVAERPRASLHGQLLHIGIIGVGRFLSIVGFLDETCHRDPSSQFVARQTRGPVKFLLRERRFFWHRTTSSVFSLRSQRVQNLPTVVGGGVLKCAIATDPSSPDELRA